MIQERPVQTPKLIVYLILKMLSFEVQPIIFKVIFNATATKFYNLILDGVILMKTSKENGGNTSPQQPTTRALFISKPLPI